MGIVGLNRGKRERNLGGYVSSMELFVGFGGKDLFIL